MRSRKPCNKAILQCLTFSNAKNRMRCATDVRTLLWHIIPAGSSHWSIVNIATLLQSSNGSIHIVTYPDFAWLIRRGLDFMIEFIGPLCNWLQQFTNHYLTHCHLLRLETLDFWPQFTTPLFHCTPSRLLTVPSYESSARTPRKTPSSVVKNECLLVCYLAMDDLLLGAYVSGCVYRVVA
jgi:hypothetical protein